MTISCENKAKIISAIVSLISSNTGIPIEQITPEKNLMNDLGMDSFSMVEIVYEIEMKFDVKIRNEDLKTLNTVNDIFKLVQGRL